MLIFDNKNQVDREQKKREENLTNSDQCTQFDDEFLTVSTEYTISSIQFVSSYLRIQCNVFRRNVFGSVRLLLNYTIHLRIHTHTVYKSELDKSCTQKEKYHDKDDGDEGK